MNQPLREIAKENGWSYRDVAVKAGSPYTTVANFLKGTTVAGEELLRKLAPVFRISPDDIENPQPKETMELRDAEAGASADVWMRRALVAEKIVADMRLALREIIDRPTLLYKQRAAKMTSSELTADEEGALLDEAARAVNVPLKSQPKREADAPSVQGAQPSADVGQRSGGRIGPPSKVRGGHE